MQNTVTAPADYQKKLRKKQSQSTLTMAWRVAGVGWVALLMTILVIFYLSSKLTAAHEEVRNNTKIIYVKLYSSGDHEVTFDFGEDTERFAEPQINSSLLNYTIKRYQVQPKTIRADYGFALTFLGAEEAQKFREEFRAAERAVEIENCKGCPREEVEIRAIRHETFKEGKTATDGTVFNSTIYFTIKQREAFTSRVIDETDYILDLQWTYLPQSGLLGEKETIDFLRANPLGIEILRQERTEDLTE